MAHHNEVTYIAILIMLLCFTGMKWVEVVVFRLLVHCSE